LDSETASPSVSEPDSAPRYTEMAVANLPKMLKPATSGEATGASTRRSGWGERAEKYP
jgi:hypothetical protein